MTWPTDIFCQKCHNLVKAGKPIHEVKKTGVTIHICHSCHTGTVEKVETSKIKKMKIKLKTKQKRNK